VDALRERLGRWMVHSPWQFSAAVGTLLGGVNGVAAFAGGESAGASAVAALAVAAVSAVLWRLLWWRVAGPSRSSGDGCG